MDLTLRKLPNSATRLSLNERFTAFASTAQNVGRARSRSRSRSRTQVTSSRVNPGTSIRNNLLLNKLERKHKLQAALKLKRRSLRTATGVNGQNRRATLNNNRLLRRNGVPKNATMRADLEAAARTLRRSNSRLDLNGRAGPRRPSAGGAAQRVAKRRLALARSQALSLRNRSRGRSLSRGRDRGLSLSQVDLRQGRQLAQNNGQIRGRSRSRSRVRLPEQLQVRGRSRSRNRLALPPAAAIGTGNNLRNNNRRGGGGIRSKSGNRLNQNRVSVKDRLGFVPSNNKRPDRRGIANGRIEKRRLKGGNAIAGSVRQGRERSRAAPRIATNRSRSRTRNNNFNNNNNNNVNQGKQRQLQQQQRTGSGNNIQNRSRSRSRARQRLNGVRQNNTNNGNRISRGGNRNSIGGNRNSIGGNRNNNKRLGGNKNRNQQQQPGKGRGRNQNRPNNKNRQQGQQNGGGVSGGSVKNEVSKDTLDKELDQYMATTKTESNIYLAN